MAALYNVWKFIVYCINLNIEVTRIETWTCSKSMYFSQVYWANIELSGVRQLDSRLSSSCSCLAIWPVQPTVFPHRWGHSFNTSRWFRWRQTGCINIQSVFSSCAAEHRPQESVAPWQDDSDCGYNKEDERRLWTPAAGGGLHSRAIHGRSEFI